MCSADRKKITQKRLIELICQTDFVPATADPVIDELRASIKVINEMASMNKTVIDSLNAKNEEYLKQNTRLTTEVNLLKVHAQECRRHREEIVPTPIQPQQQQNLDPNNNADAIRKEIDEIKSDINNIQQYLRINNLEVVGLPEPNDGESEEKLLLNAFNNLQGLENPIRAEDIDISHPLNTKRRDGKAVHVVRFISRKTKLQILDAKKRAENKEYRFRNRDVYVNEHLSPNNRSLFAKAQEKKRELNYKYCWTRGGSINMRKTDDSQVITISKDTDLVNLV